MRRKIPMAKSNTVTVEALAELGTGRLACLLLDAAENDPAPMRTLRIAVASREGAAAAAAEIDAAIQQVGRGRSFDDSRRRPTFVRELTALRDAIEGPLAGADPMTALDRMFDFIDLAPSVIERSADNGSVGDLFRAACDTAAGLAARAVQGVPPERTYVPSRYISRGTVSVIANA
jgi:hypothetical protein